MRFALALLVGALPAVASAQSLPSPAFKQVTVNGFTVTGIGALTSGSGAIAPLASPAFTGTPTGPTPLLADNSTRLATTAWVIAQGYGTGSSAVTSVAGRTGAVTLSVGDVSGAAPLASPAFTGTPTTPTALTSDSSTTVASTAFVKSQNYVTSSGAAGAAPVQSVSGRTGTVTLTTSDVSGSAPLASPAFTGTPTVPTAATSTNTTQAASTAFVLGQAATVAPLAAGTASVGTSTLYARQDHVHPTDTTRAASGANTDITSLGGITTPISTAQGGTGNNGGAWPAWTTSYGTTGGAGFSVAHGAGTSALIEGKKLYFSVDDTLSYTTIPTGITLTLPSSKVSAARQTIVGTNLATGAIIYASIASGASSFTLYAGGGFAVPVSASGQEITFTGTIQIQ